MESWIASRRTKTDGSEVCRGGGFSLHANIGIKGHERDRLERLCRYVSRPPDANERLSVSEFDGQVCYRLKNKWRDGSEMVVFSPTEFLEKLVFSEATDLPEKKDCLGGSLGRCS